MWPLFGVSSIMACDEVLPFLREGTAPPGDDVVYVGGKPVKRDPTTMILRATVQPVDGRDLMLVPEGDRFTENLWVYVDKGCAPILPPHEPNPDDQGACLAPFPQDDDKVLRNGKVYQVQECQDWGSYVRARVTLVDVGPDVKSLFPALADHMAG